MSVHCCSGYKVRWSYVIRGGGNKATALLFSAPNAFNPRTAPSHSRTVSCGGATRSPGTERHESAEGSLFPRKRSAWRDDALALAFYVRIHVDVYSDLDYFVIRQDEGVNFEMQYCFYPVGWMSKDFWMILNATELVHCVPWDPLERATVAHRSG